jgi:multifunctional beta-oxidation protein
LPPQLVGKAISTFGRIDIVVCNAVDFLIRTSVVLTSRQGIVRSLPFAETTFAVFEQFWRIHIGGHVSVIQAAWPHLIKQKYGRVICVSSSSGLVGMPTLSAYCSAKGGVHGLMRALSLEVSASRMIERRLTGSAGQRTQHPGQRVEPQWLHSNALRPQLARRYRYCHP